MKKLLALILAAALALSLTACGGGTNGTTSSGSGSSQEEEVQLSELALAAIFATKEVKDYLDDNLKNPQSLAINSIKGGVREGLDFIFEIDYTAENGFGGSVREQLYISISGSSSEGYGIKSYGDSTFTGSQNQMYTGRFYNELALEGEIFFGEEGKEEPIETLLINPEDLAGAGIFNFNVDTILENI